MLMANERLARGLRGALLIRSTRWADQLTGTGVLWRRRVACDWPATRVSVDLRLDDIGSSARHLATGGLLTGWHSRTRDRRREADRYGGESAEETILLNASLGGRYSYSEPRDFAPHCWPSTARCQSKTTGVAHFQRRLQDTGEQRVSIPRVRRTLRLRWIRQFTDDGPVESPAVTQQQLQRVGTPVGKQIIQVSAPSDVAGYDVISLAEHFAEAFRGWLL